MKRFLITMIEKPFKFGLSDDEMHLEIGIFWITIIIIVIFNP
jgi:hypothetical protein